MRRMTFDISNKLPIHLKFGLVALCLFVSLISLSQSRKQIDSLNHLPFEQKVKNPKQLLPEYLKIAGKARQIDYPIGEFEAYENASLLYYYLGKYDFEIKYALRSIAGFQKLGDQEKVARFYGELGYRMKRHNMLKALYYMQKGIHLAETEKLEHPLMGLYDNYGVLKEMQGQYDSAFYFYQKGLHLKQKYKDRSGLPYSLNNLGGLMLLEKKYSEARSHFLLALKLREQLKDTLGMCETYLLLSDVELAESQYDAADQHLKFVIQQAASKGLYLLLSNAYEKRAQVQEASGNLLTALRDERLSQQFKDSITQQSMRNKQAELEVQFDTQEKEKALLLERLKVNKFENWLWIFGLLLIIVFLTTLSIQFRRTSEKRKLEVKNLKDLEFERMRISRDLHDNIGAELTLITAKLDIKAASTKSEEEQKDFNELATLSREASLLLRETIWSIRQESITKGDLLEKIEQFAKKRMEPSCHYESRIIGDAHETIPAANALHLYRIAQEAINNSIKYAHSSCIEIVFNQNGLTIGDNGQGFNTEDYKAGYGIQNMQQRAKEIGAEFQLISNERGTSIRILNW